MRRLLVLIAAVALAGCGTTNHSIGSLQFNSAVEPLAADYLEITRDAVRGRPRIENSQLLVSRPNTLSGETGFDPMRWYVCVRGIKPSGEPPGPSALPLSEHIANFVWGSGGADHYDLVVVFRQGMHRAVAEGFDSRLCRDLAYEPLTLD